MRTLVIITAYNRLTSLVRLAEELHSQDETTEFVVFDDHSDEQFKPMSPRVKVFSALEHLGKAGFWRTYNNIFAYCEEHEYDYYIILPDDVEPCPNFVAKCIDAYDKSGCICVSPLITNRSFLHGYSRFGNKKVTPTEWGFLSHYFDCCGIMKRDFFEALGWHMERIELSDNPYRSSGVGKQITERLQALGKPMGHVYRTLLATTNDESEMNKEERKLHPLYADWRDNEPCVDVHMASLWRGGHILKTVESVMKQPELNQIYATLNNYTDEQFEYATKELDALSKQYGKKINIRRGDNAKRSNEKMAQLYKSKAKYIAMCDDDIVYPTAYFMRMIQGCQANNAMVSWHGGTFVEWPLTRYYNHGSRHCLSWQREFKEDTPCDILGNVFTFFRRDMFTDAEYKQLYEEAGTCSMDDIYMGCLAAKKGIPRIVLWHFYEPGNPLCPIHKEMFESDHYVYDQYKNHDPEQVEYLNTHMDKSMLTMTLHPEVLADSKPQPPIVRFYQKKYPRAKVYMKSGFLYIEYYGAYKKYKV